MPRPTAEAGGCRTKNIMKRICIISLFILLASCTPVQNATSTKQTGELTLDMQPACKDLIDGLCVVSEPGEWLGEGKTTVITEKPEAAFLDDTTAIQIKIEGWTLVFSPGLNTPFSVGMTFPDATLYPAGGYSVSMTVENNGKKCDDVEGTFTDDILQSAQKNEQQINPIMSFDIRFAMRCNKQHQVILGRVKLSQS
ncbi:MAG: hypothetical protein ABSF99_10260 [Anaerolineales bacterium]